MALYEMSKAYNALATPGKRPAQYLALTSKPAYKFYPYRKLPCSSIRHTSEYLPPLEIWFVKQEHQTKIQ